MRYGFRPILISAVFIVVVFVERRFHYSRHVTNILKGLYKNPTVLPQRKNVQGRGTVETERKGVEITSEQSSGNTSDTIAKHHIQKGYDKIVFLPRGDSSLNHLGFFDAYMPNYETTSNESALFPTSPYSFHDRVREQLSYAPNKNTPRTFMSIYIPQLDWYIPEGATGLGQKTFLDKRCRVAECSLTLHQDDMYTADMVVLAFQQGGIYRNQYKLLTSRPRRPGQIWAMLVVESPNHTYGDMFGGKEFNWTISYSPSSTIPLPYAQMYPAKPGVTTLPQTRNYAQGKSGKVIWIVSNCETPNNRMAYAKELQKYIDVDIYGKCGKAMCSTPTAALMIGPYQKCAKDIINRYKFYLSFENSNCNTYVTEKFFEQGLSNDVIPIVMGALPAYYKHVAPPDSFIHVEQFQNASDLARYLHEVDRDDALYNKYFRWKGAWRFMPFANIFCRMCAMLHVPNKGNTVNTVAKWKDSEQCRKPVKP